MAVAAHGRIGVYEVSGQYQLYVDRLIPAGEGALFQEFLRLKAELEKEGLFESERKRPLPPRPQRIGLVTSQTGAALRDVLNTLRRRNPMAEVILAPAAVQGDEAPGQTRAGPESTQCPETSSGCDPSCARWRLNRGPLGFQRSPGGSGSCWI